MRPRKLMASAGSAVAARPELHRVGGGPIPTSALQEIRVDLIPHWIARHIFRNHYLGTVPGGTQHCFGVFLHKRLEGAVALGAGPFNGHKIVRGASQDDCSCLTRLYMSNRLPKNSESRVLGIVSRLLRKNTKIKFLVSYADPAQGHRGTVYQAAGWTYLGLSSAMPLYSVNGGSPEHSRSLSHRIGTHSVPYMRSRGLHVKVVRQQRKHRYALFLDPSWRDRLTVQPQPYPKEI